MASIISSIGFGQLLSTPINYDHNLLRDLGGTYNLLGEYNGDKERLVVLIRWSVTISLNIKLSSRSRNRM